MIKRIEEMIHRVDDKNFGYCKTCGFEIGFSRLKVRPIAEECVDCKQFAEIKERHQRKSQ
ncbi:TraR/DksA C4-type zinc finger protein [Legionella jordanis]|uniref:TraR/DksA C4-type zinc finger protein n=1 Tax=Legionella jordanis TaxID=456 RepID=UPI000EFCBF4E|nr:TraR/DksA C4-type zinc finger protein [Legionella jordanis]RMW99303.1 hypothetical protein EAW55_13940 [Legionella jordanis]